MILIVIVQRFTCLAAAGSALGTYVGRACLFEFDGRFHRTQTGMSMSSLIQSIHFACQCRVMVVHDCRSQLTQRRCGEQLRF